MGKVVLANGCFDLFHYGHLLHLEAAKKMGDMLVVSITADRFVNKGPGRPVYPAEHRAALVKALACVDDVVIVSGLAQALEMVKPDIVVKGCDYTRLDSEHEAYCKAHGIEMRFTPGVKFSATQFLKAAHALG